MRPAIYLIIRAFTSIAVAIVFLGFADACQSASVIAGDTIKFEDTSGNSVSLLDFKGKPVVLNLWASWCSPCVEEMPSLAKLQEKYKDKGLVVLALSEDHAPANVMDFYSTNSITALHPFFDRNHFVWLAMRARGIPTSILIDKNGAEIQRMEGTVKWQSDDVTKTIDALIGK